MGPSILGCMNMRFHDLSPIYIGPTATRVGHKPHNIAVVPVPHHPIPYPCLPDDTRSVDSI